ncbi:hypothetical protein [Nostoc sp. 'Peltigera membranacea cyanobiont' 210A]|uniref:hypothetical protein n=1 Tax=Nostoc sp. 'Peltigera membranacea cyanobiont' 210A TaxID=2014529 RepID=UPI00117E0F8D|nr:hypothetical protein [Nostoc sp. 'Peltigera membranacea cyanobiont' 210A]
MTFQSFEIAFSGQAFTLAIFIVSFISSIFQASYQGRFSLDNQSIMLQRRSLATSIWHAVGQINGF